MANPFDQFSSDFRAAVPDAGPPSAAPMAQPEAAPKPVMNAPQQPPPAMGSGMMGAPPPPQQPPMGGGMYGQPPPLGQQSSAMVPSAQPSNPYGGLVGMGGAPPQAAPGGPPPLGGMYGQPPPPAAAPSGPPPLGGMYGQPPPPQQQPPQQPPPSMSGSITGSIVAPAGGAPPAAALSADPFGASYGAPPPAPMPAPAPPAPAPLAPAPAPLAPAPAPQPAYNPDPFGAAPAAPAPAALAPAAPEPAAGALVPSSAPSDDPFGIFGSLAPVAAAPVAPAPVAPASAVTSDDPFGMGFSSAPVATDTASAATPTPVAAPPAPTEIVSRSAPAPAAADTGAHRKSGDLPPGGEWYDARIFTPTLGVMFFKPQELTDSLFLQTDKSLVEALDERPVVAFIVEGSSARSAGVELGHVLLKVNGIDVKNPKEASRLIKEGPRPLPLLFYVPDTSVVVAEGEHMVKYDTRETGAPNSAKDWKPKYVVIGGIIAQPWMMNMYRSKSEYDIAVIETQARRPVSVKVKQFSLQGARIQNDWQGPQMVKYKNKLHPWKYFVVLPVARNPIKISSPNLSQLKPVHEGIRRVLMAQQRGHAHQPRTAAPVRQGEGYGQRGHSPTRGGGYGADVSGGVGGPRRAQY